MSKWLQVDLDTETPEDRQLIRGVKVKLLVSPYDIPEAVRGFYDEQKHRFVIEFRYIGDEPTELQPQDRHITLVVGKNSGRLYGIEIDVDTLKVEVVGLRMEIIKEVNEALDNLVQKSISPSRRDNYRLTKDAISARQEQLFLPLSKRFSGV